VWATPELLRLFLRNQPGLSELSKRLYCSGAGIVIPFWELVISVYHVHSKRGGWLGSCSITLLLRVCLDNQAMASLHSREASLRAVAGGATHGILNRKSPRRQSRREYRRSEGKRVIMRTSLVVFVLVSSYFVSPFVRKLEAVRNFTPAPPNYVYPRIFWDRTVAI